MSETVNIAAMAEILSGKLFGAFGWKQFGPINFNFTDDTECKRHTKYPCDVIFGYEHPFLREWIYLITDLKSYSKASVESKEKIQSNINGLASALRCARISSEFKKNLPKDGDIVNGLLFIYNNDNEYDKDFGTLLKDKGPTSIDIPLHAKLHVFGPPQIQFLCDIVNDLEKVFGEDTPLPGAFRFFYPNQISRIPEKNEWSAAGPEILTSPYIIAIYTKEIRQQLGKEIIVKEIKHTNFYYRGEGDTFEEFCFILDYCFRYSLIDDYQKIKIKMPYCCESAAANFDKAKLHFSEHFYKQAGGFEKLNQVELCPIASAMFEFHDKIIGMEKRKEFSHVNK